MIARFFVEGYYSFAETATFLQIIRNWFNVMNVKSLYSEQKSRDERRASISYDDRNQLDFLWLGASKNV